MMNLTLVAQQLEIPLEQLKSICQVLKIEIVKNAVTPNDKEKIQEFIRVCKEKQITLEQGLQELEQFQKEAQAQQKVLGERFNLDEFFKQRIGTSPEELKPGSYHYDLYQLLLKSQSISQVGYTLFREVFLRQTQDLIMNGMEADSINQNQTVAGFDKAFGSIETQFEQNFLGNSINWEEQEHPMLEASRKTALPSRQKTNISPSPSLKK